MLRPFLLLLVLLVLWLLLRLLNVIVAIENDIERVDDLADRFGQIASEHVTREHEIGHGVAVAGGECEAAVLA